MALQAAQLLLTQNWGDISQLFQSRQPNSAEEFCVRALLALYVGKGSPDWSSVIDDLRQACAMKPTDPLLSCNLTQALLDTQQADQAYDCAEQMCNTFPNSLPALEKHVLAAVATLRWPQAHQSLVHAKGLMGDKQQMPDWASNLLFELSPQWWIPLEAGGVVLRIPDASDTKFLKETFGNTDFMHRYHRFQGASDEAVESFISNARLSPRRTGRLDWIVLDQNDKRVGLFAFVDIDWKNNRGEALIGFPVERSPAVSLKASVAAMDFAFRRLGLQKIVSYVYADNPEAQANTLHFGFVQEGLLRSHIQTELGRCDIFVNGLTPSDFAANGLICSLARRWIRENTPHLNAQSPQEPSVGGGTASGMGANVRALVTFTPVNAGAYYLGVRGVPVN